ncbi:MAG TPA: cob(I)yrinic acid a,c-diamide adenosyltransferase [Candidatus Deferrimicrobium sp.]|nr:cob(I)yrinic acid a,c-diamide adenosyltransferase [Candidatus Deferrimicrobium sp.]
MMTDEEPKASRGLVMVYTGHGKGKTTAALGMCVRAVGYNWNICVIQFVKGSWKYGELKGLERLKPNVELHVVGEGFVGIIDDTKDFEEHREAARKGISLAIEKVSSGQYQLVIVDELNVALKLGLVSEDEVRSILDACNPAQHLLITGRDAPDWLTARADLVTEMREIKHPFQKGVLAQKGIDW